MFGLLFKKRYYVHDKNHTIHADFKAWDLQDALKVTETLDLGEDFDWDGAYIAQKGSYQQHSIGNMRSYG